jgi:hypothetical protein
MIAELIRAYNGSFNTERMDVATIRFRLLTFGRTGGRIETFGAMIASRICFAPVMIRGTNNTLNSIAIILAVPKHMPLITTIESNHSFHIRIAITDKFYAIPQLIPFAFNLPNPVIITVCSTSPATRAMNASISYTNGIQ